LTMRAWTAMGELLLAIVSAPFERTTETRSDFTADPGPTGLDASGDRGVGGSLP
jgi:hypothetical protein